MKTLLIASFAFAALGASSAAFAQAAGPVGGAPQSPVVRQGGRLNMKERERINEEILAKLNLTPDQRTRIEAHQKETMEKLRELRKAGGGAKGAGASEDTKEKLKAIRKENQEFMKSVLTKDQMREMMRMRREAIREEQAKGGAAPVKP